MQTTLPLNGSNPLRNVTGLARQISLPGEHAPLRFPSFPALERTAVMGFNQPATMKVPAAKETKVLVMRQAAYPVWSESDTAFGYSTSYATAFNDQIASGAVYAGTAVSYEIRPNMQSWTGMSSTGAGRPVANAFYPAVTFNAEGSETVYPIVGKTESGPEWTYLPAGSAWTVLASAAIALPSAQTVAIQYEMWSSPTEVAGAPTILSITTAANTMGGFVTSVVPYNMWVRPTGLSTETVVGNTVPALWGITFVVGSSQTINVACTMSAANAGSVVYGTKQPLYRCFMPLTVPNEFRTSPLPWFAARVTAAAMLGTNVTQVLNKGGTILGGRVSPSVIDPYNVTSAYISALHPAEKAFLPLETGVYTYCPPSTDLVFFTDYTSNSQNMTSVPTVALSNDAMVNVIFLTPPPAVDATMAVTVTWHIEFRTSSALFQIGLSAMTLESLHQAQLVLAESGYFFENPEHDRLLAKVISTAKKYAPAVAGAINPAAGRMLQSVITKMSGKGRRQATTIKPKPGPSKPPATTAASSGITSKGKGAGKGRKPAPPPATGRGRR